MGKHYGAQIIAKVLEVKELGNSNQIISEHFNLSVKQIKNLLTRYRINQEKIANGLTIKPKGRPQASNLTDKQRQELEIKRLKTENDLLRAFLAAAGRM
jgi:predicted XRE-type DNA-binding protein